MTASRGGPLAMTITSMDVQWFGGLFCVLCGAVILFLVAYLVVTNG